MLGSFKLFDIILRPVTCNTAIIKLGCDLNGHQEICHTMLYVGFGRRFNVAAFPQSLQNTGKRIDVSGNILKPVT